MIWKKQPVEHQISELNSNITIHDLGSQANDTNFNNAIKAVCNSANANSPYWVKITHAYAASGVFDYAQYVGYVVKDKSSYGWNIYLSSDVNNVDGYYNSNTSALTWSDKLTTKNLSNQITDKHEKIDQYYCYRSGNVCTGRIYGNGLPTEHGSLLCRLPVHPPFQVSCPVLNIATGQLLGIVYITPQGRVEIDGNVSLSSGAYADINFSFVI